MLIFLKKIHTIAKIITKKSYYKKIIFKIFKILNKFYEPTYHQSVCPYGLTIRRFFKFCFHVTSFPATKIDQNLPYTPEQCTYITREQIHLETNLKKETYTKWPRFYRKKWYSRHEKLILLFITGIFSIYGSCWVPQQKMMGAPRLSLK